MARYIDADIPFEELTKEYRYAKGEARKVYRRAIDIICGAKMDGGNNDKS